MSSPKMADPVDELTTLTDLSGISHEERYHRIPIWHRFEQRKISGAAAPRRMNLAKYLEKYHSCDVYIGQDHFCALKPGEVDEKSGKVISVEDISRVAMWNRVKKRKLSGYSAPLRKNLERCLMRNPDLEIYIGQDRCGEGYHAPDCEALIGEQGVPCIREDIQNAKENLQSVSEDLSLDPFAELPLGLDDSADVGTIGLLPEDISIDSWLCLDGENSIEC